MVILRNNLNGDGNQTYLLKIRLVCTDAKKALQNYLKDEPTHINISLTKPRIKAIFQSKLLGFLPKKNVEPIAEWFFNISVQEGYIMEKPTISATRNDEYAINPAILLMKPGPKK